MTHGLSATELAQIRDDIEGLLPDTCHILSLTRTSDNAGGWSEAWGTATALVACRLDYKMVTDKMTGERLKSFSEAILTMPYDTSITSANRIEVSGAQWTVQGVNVNQSWIGGKRVEIQKA